MVGHVEGHCDLFRNNDKLMDHLVHGSMADMVNPVVQSPLARSTLVLKHVLCANNSVPLR